MVVADLGSGAGYLALPAAKMVGEGGKVYAVDFDEKQIEALKRKAANRGLSNIEARASSAANLEFIVSGTVDVVIAKGLICCMLDHDGALGEIKRIVKPDGTIFLSVSKLGRKADMRTVSKEEWERTLEGFKVERRGEGLVDRWAWTKNRRST